MDIAKRILNQETLAYPNNKLREAEKVHEISSSYHLTFFVLINLLRLDLRACEMHFLLPPGLGNLSWLKVNTKVKD